MAGYFMVVFVSSIFLSSAYSQQNLRTGIGRGTSRGEGAYPRNCIPGYFQTYYFRSEPYKQCCIEQLRHWENYPLPIKRLDCRYRQLSHYANATVPSDVQVINLSFTRFRNKEEELGRTFLSRLPQIQSLVFVSCGMTNLPSNFFAANGKLDYVDLSWNQLETIPEDLFSSSPDLKKVVLRGNQLTGLPDNVFRNNRNLETLIIARNRLQYLRSQLFSSTPNLRHLDASLNEELRCIGSEVLRNIPKISYVNLEKAGQWIISSLRRLFCDDRQICPRSIDHLNDTVNAMGGWQIWENSIDCD